MDWIWPDSSSPSYNGAKRAKITASALQKNNKTIIEINEFWGVGDVFIILKKSAEQYYIAKWMGHSGRSKVFEVKRLDGHNIIDLDLNALIKGNTVVITGFTQEECSTC
jgi:hypothetical protein